MKRISCLFYLVLVGLSFQLTGCDEFYSEAIKYGVRTDPLILSDQLGDERNEPDPPGLLPLSSPKDLLKPLNPMFDKRAKIMDYAAGTPLSRDPMLISTDDRNEIFKALTALFGTPAKPAANLDPNVVEVLKLQPDDLEKGSRLYRIHCLHCHGVTGDGHGPTARWVNPHPRDYRQGLFKFQSVNQTDGSIRPPLREDLMHTLAKGIEGTAMPSFMILPLEDREKLVSYVINLSIRGQAEFDTIKSGFRYDKEKKQLVIDEDFAGDYGNSIAEVVKVFAKLNATKWVEAQTKRIQPAPYPYKDGDMAALKESVLRGYKYFIGDPKDPVAKSTNCVSCHKDFGRQSTFRFDKWGTLVKPRNFTDGVFRGGNTPIDVYDRIHSGINGSGMLNFGKLEQQEPKVIWDLVNFVQTLPYPAMRKSFGINID